MDTKWGQASLGWDEGEVLAPGSKCNGECGSWEILAPLQMTMSQDNAGRPLAIWYIFRGYLWCLMQSPSLAGWTQWEDILHKWRGQLRRWIKCWEAGWRSIAGRGSLEAWTRLSKTSTMSCCLLLMMVSSLIMIMTLSLRLLAWYVSSTFLGQIL